MRSLGDGKFEIALAGEIVVNNDKKMEQKAKNKRKVWWVDFDR